jgi:hypothetical protein
MYWFCCVNDNSEIHKNMYLVALNSAIKNTSLSPILVYDGIDEKFVSDIESKNGRVIRYKTSLYNKPNFMAACERNFSGWKGTACGAYLRIDVPIICRDLNITDETVLYTDTDVIFLMDVVGELNQHKPKYFSVCPETQKNNYDDFNSGVMLMNLQGMLSTYENFTIFIENNHYNFTAYDQGALQTFYKNRINHLPLYFNHKPYWGVVPESRIIHYHGPKHNHIIDYLNGVVFDPYTPLFQMVCIPTWTYYKELYESYQNI